MPFWAWMIAFLVLLLGVAWYVDLRGRRARRTLDGTARRPSNWDRWAELDRTAPGTSQEAHHLAEPPTTG